MAKKKVVMILLEGPSDATALGAYFKDFFRMIRLLLTFYIQISHRSTVYIQILSKQKLDDILVMNYVD